MVRESERPAPAKTLAIPLSLAGQADINRLLREIGKLDDFFLAANARKGGEPGQAPPRVTRLLSALATDNRLNLLQEKDRGFLKEQLQKILLVAPNLHISFAAEPSPKIMERILSWLRENVHPQALIVVGLAPGIAAGMVLRTPNKVFDLSLQAHLKEQEDYLVKLIAEAGRG